MLVEAQKFIHISLTAAEQKINIFILHFHKLYVYIFSYDSYTCLKTLLLKTSSIYYCYIRLPFNRNIGSEGFCERDVLKNFAIFTGKHKCGCFFLIKLHFVRQVTVLKRDPNTGVLL